MWLVTTVLDSASLDIGELGSTFDNHVIKIYYRVIKIYF